MIRERIVGFDPEEFWARRLPHARAADMTEKYEALSELARLPAEARKPAIRAIASRWRGGLREAELIGPVRVAERLAAARVGTSDPEATAATWRDRGRAPCAVILWSHLHPLVDDLVRFRRVGGGSMVEWVAGDPTLVDRWPAPERVPELVGPRQPVRMAYLWLGIRTGLALDRLNNLLFDRSGPWDHRPGDPIWAHDGDPS